MRELSLIPSAAKLFSPAVTRFVRDGFEFTFPVPLDINYSDEEGLLSLYALDAVHSHEAGGAFDRFLVGGNG